MRKSTCETPSQPTSICDRLSDVQYLKKYEMPVQPAKISERVSNIYFHTFVTFYLRSSLYPKEYLLRLHPLRRSKMNIFSGPTWVNMDCLLITSLKNEDMKWFHHCDFLFSALRMFKIRDIQYMKHKCYKI